MHSGQNDRRATVIGHILSRSAALVQKRLKDAAAPGRSDLQLSVDPQPQIGKQLLALGFGGLDGSQSKITQDRREKDGSKSMGGHRASDWKNVI